MIKASLIIVETSYQSLYRRYRPQRFSQVVGQDHLIIALRNSVIKAQISHAYLFSGPRGTGKTSTARILAKALNCINLKEGEPCCECQSCISIAQGNSPDVHELDAASNNGVDAMRELISRASLGTPGRSKVYIIDEVHMLSTAASNALLKTLEEPPSHVIFILATTDPHKVLPTIRSRTQHLEFNLLSAQVMSLLLEKINTEAELGLSETSLKAAISKSSGSARDALSALDQIAAGGELNTSSNTGLELVEAICEKDSARAIQAIAQAINFGKDPQGIAYELLDSLRNGFLVSLAPQLATVEGETLNVVQSQLLRLGMPRLVRSMEVIGKVQASMPSVIDQRTALEVGVLSLTTDEESSLAKLEQRVSILEKTIKSFKDSSGLISKQSSQESISKKTSSTVSDKSDDKSEKNRSSVSRNSFGALKQALRSQQSKSITYKDNTEPEQDLPTESFSSNSTIANSATKSLGAFPTREQIVSAWGDHLITKLRPRVKALFIAGRFSGVEKDQVFFSLPNSPHLKRCEEYKLEVQQALSNFFKCPISLNLVLDQDQESNHQQPGSSQEPELEEEFDISEQPLPKRDVVSLQDQVLKTFPGAREVDI